MGNMRFLNHVLLKYLAASAALLLVVSCATPQKDAGFAEVSSAVQTRSDEVIKWRHGGPEDAEVDQQIQALLSRPLSQESAVSITLLNNRGLQAEYEELGVAQADLVQAGLLRNPAFSWSRMEGSVASKTNWGLEFDFLNLLLLPSQKRLYSLRFEQTKLRVAQAVINKVAETRKAWVEAISAEQNAVFLGQIKDLMQIESELYQRQHAAGNVSQRDVLIHQSFAMETVNEWSIAQDAATSARERLNRLMGLKSEEMNWKFPEKMPAMPKFAPVSADIEKLGLSQRLDLQVMQKESEAMAAGLKLTRDSRWINVFDLGVETERATGERRITGPTLKLELPIFDQKQAQVSRQEALYRQSEVRLYEAAVNAQSEIRESLQRLQNAESRVKQARDELIPLRGKLVEETTRYYNGMLLGVYDLLADVRAQIYAVQSKMNAERDCWVALADLQLALGGKLPDPAK
jgi:outer membrane protein TolC